MALFADAGKGQVVAGVGVADVADHGADEFFIIGDVAIFDVAVLGLNRDIGRGGSMVVGSSDLLVGRQVGAVTGIAIELSLRTRDTHFLP